ncbi:MAG: beta-ketoacyl-ACP synthase II [Ruminococcus sp.]|nr:beta-ketoacyl-ACP synthase II [Ruminococcus sp.]
MARRVVVTGLGAVSPVGNTVPEMWKNMVAGVNGIEEITAFDTSDLKVHIAGTVKGFQPELYFEKREAKKLDIYCQYAMAAAQQAVDDSGILGHIDENRFGVYIGAGIGGLNTFVNNTVGLELGGPRKVSPFFIPMMIGNIATGNVAIRFGAKGVSLSVMSACATGTNSIGEAFHAVKDGYADAIIAGGAEAVVARLTIAGFQNMKALSTNPDPSKASRPFDKDRDGFVMGEGAGMLILEEYEHAKARGAKIYAEFSGYGNTCDAHHVTAPDPEGAGLARAIAIAFEEANVGDDANVYINAHGTSTHLNDLTETMAIKKALGEKAYDASISSTKSMTGHMLGATGAIEAIAAVKAIEEGVVPPTINLDEPDEGLDLDYTPKVAKKRDIDVAASTNLGFGGHDACVVFKKIAD